MMTIRPFIYISAVFLLSCSQTSETPEAETRGTVQIVEPTLPAQISKKNSFNCPYQEQREIYFSSDKIKDSLDIRIIGEDCDTAKINLRIITLEGHVIHNTTARALSYTYEDVGAAGIERMLQGLVTTVSQAQDFPENITDLTEMNGYYEVDLEAVKAAKTNNLPFFCHKAGKSFSNCFIFWQGRTIFAYSSGS